ncbi:MAG: hypothetical protein KJN60_00170 [Boseongicola sp.]|nr:hypothetical protein [Boseongicola sp.]
MATKLKLTVAQNRNVTALAQADAAHDVSNVKALDSLQRAVAGAKDKDALLKALRPAYTHAYAVRYVATSETVLDDEGAQAFIDANAGYVKGGKAKLAVKAFNAAAAAWQRVKARIHPTEKKGNQGGAKRKARTTTATDAPTKAASDDGTKTVKAPTRTRKCATIAEFDNAIAAFCVEAMATTKENLKLPKMTVARRQFAARIAKEWKEITEPEH